MRLKKMPLIGHEVGLIATPVTAYELQVVFKKLVDELEVSLSSIHPAQVSEIDTTVEICHLPC